MNKTKKLIEESLLLSIEAISNDIQQGCLDSNDILNKTKAIRELVESYDTVIRGRYLDD